MTEPRAAQTARREVKPSGKLQLCPGFSSRDPTEVFPSAPSCGQSCSFLASCGGSAAVTVLGLAGPGQHRALSPGTTSGASPRDKRGLPWTQRAPLEPARRCLLVLKTLRAPGFGLALDREWSGSVHEGAVTLGTSPVQDHRGLSQLRMAREGQEEQQCDTAPMETGAEPPEPHPATHLQLPQLWEIRNPCLKTSHPLLT